MKQVLSRSAHLALALALPPLLWAWAPAARALEIEGCKFSKFPMPDEVRKCLRNKAEQARKAFQEGQKAVLGKPIKIGPCNVSIERPDDALKCLKEKLAEAAKAPAGIIGGILGALKGAEIEKLVGCLGRGQGYDPGSRMRDLLGGPDKSLRVYLEGAWGASRDAVSGLLSRFVKALRESVQKGTVPALPDLGKVLDDLWSIFERSASQGPAGQCLLDLLKPRWAPLKGQFVTLGGWMKDTLTRLWEEKVQPLVEELGVKVLALVLDQGLDKIGTLLGDPAFVPRTKQIVARHLVFERIKPMTESLAALTRALRAKDQAAIQTAWKRAAPLYDERSQVGLSTVIDIGRDLILIVGDKAIERLTPPLVHAATLVVDVVKAVVLRVVTAVAGLIPFAGGAVSSLATAVVSVVAKLALKGFEIGAPLIASTLFKAAVNLLAGMVKEKLTNAKEAKLAELRKKTGGHAGAVNALVDKFIEFAKKWANEDAAVLNGYHAQVKALGETVVPGAAKK